MTITAAAEGPHPLASLLRRYRDVLAAVRDVSDAHAYHLLEAFASAVAASLLDRFPLSAVRVRVRKPEVVLSTPVEHAAVVVERAR